MAAKTACCLHHVSYRIFHKFKKKSRVLLGNVELYVNFTKKGELLSIVRVII
jgi:hypothetical protein